MSNTAQQTATYKEPKVKGEKIPGNRGKGALLRGYKLLTPQTDKTATYSPLFAEIADLRIYGTQSTNRACVWVHKRGGKESVYTSGAGKAGGYGYHRASAAAEAALNDAGFTFTKGISGVGDDAIKEGLLAVGRALGLKKLQVVEFYE